MKHTQRPSLIWENRNKVSRQCKSNHDGDDTVSIVHSYAVGNGDMFSISHGSDSCTIIDCSISEENEKWLLKEIDKQRKGKGITRFISTHPDQDHIMGLKKLDDHIHIVNFYVVKNNAMKEDETEDFKHYKKLRDGDSAFYIYKGRRRKWLNEDSEERGGAGIHILWPITSNGDFKTAMRDAEAGKSPNNISPVITYSLEDGVRMAWFGDLETDFMKSIEAEIKWPYIDIIFAPHHGRESGKIPKSILNKINPKIIIIGEAPSEHLNYYSDYNTITQNSAGSIYFECTTNWVHIYVENSRYSVDFLENKKKMRYNNYIGSLAV